MRSQHANKTTMDDIARATGLSKMTVSRVLSNSSLVSGDTRDRVLAATKRMNYHVDFIARQLRAKHTLQLGVVVPFQGLVGGYYFGQILQGIQQVIAGTDYHIALFDSHSEGFNDFRKCVNLCHERRVGALIVVAPGLGEKFPKTFVELKMPLVAVGSSFGRQHVNYVDVDNRGGASAMTDYLIRMGHRKIGFLKGPSDLRDAAQRELGFRKTMAGHRVPVVDRWVVQGDYETRKAFHLSLNLLSKADRPTAIFASNDNMAYGVIDAARILGLRVPEDLSVAGFDDAEGSASFVPALTTVAQPMMDLGKVATRYLLDVLNKSGAPPTMRQILPAQVVARASVTSPSGEIRRGKPGAYELEMPRTTRLN